DQRLAHHAVNGSAHEERLIKEQLHVDILRQCSGYALQRLFDVFDDVQRGSAAVSHHGNQRAAEPVLADDVGLRRKTVSDLSDIADVRGSAVLRPDGKRVDFGNRVRTSVHRDGVLQRADFGGAGRQYQVLRIDGVYYIHWRQPLGLHGGCVNIHGYHALLAAVREGNRGAADGGHLRADEVHRKIIQRLLRKALAADADLHDGNAGSRINNDQRRRGSLRELPHRRLRD